MVGAASLSVNLFILAEIVSVSSVPEGG